MGESSLDLLANTLEKFPQENAKRNEKLVRAKCGMYSTHTSVTLNKKQIKIPKIHKTRHPTFQIGLFQKNRYDIIFTSKKMT